MNSVKARPSNILLVAITRMGDMLQATPTIVGLKRQYPGARISVMIEKQFASICEGIPGIDQIIEIDLALVCQCLHREGPGIVDAYRYLDGIVSNLRSQDFDMCMNMSSSAYTALLLRMLNVKDNRGWTADDEGYRILENPWTMLFAAFIYHSNREYNSINLVDIFRCSADVTQHPHRLVYDVPERTAGFAEKFLADEGLGNDGPLIAIQAGASQEKRQWSPARFAKVAELLIEQLNARIVWTGSRSEAPILEAILTHFRHPRMVSAVGKTDLAQLAALLKSSRLLITGDTGPMHLSVAVGTPVVALFLASAFCFETGPYGPGNIVMQPQVGCNPCNPNVPCTRPDCHEQISPELVTYLTKLRLEHEDQELLAVSISAQVADPRETTIYVTAFDEEGFLEFVPLNGIAARKGYAEQYYETARAAHRLLWKSQFGFAKDDHIPAASVQELESINGLGEAIALAEQGKAAIDELLRVIHDPKMPARRLGELNAALLTLDRQLENTGLEHSVLGAVIRMFIMEKENLRGDDPLMLASRTKELYDSLRQRCERFGSFFRHFAGKSQSPLRILQ